MYVVENKCMCVYGYIRLHKSKTSRSGRISRRQHCTAPGKPQWPRTLVVRFQCCPCMIMLQQGVGRIPSSESVIGCDLMWSGSMMFYVMFSAVYSASTVDTSVIAMCKITPKKCRLHESHFWIFMKTKTDRCDVDQQLPKLQIGTPTPKKILWHSTSLNQFSWKCSTKSMCRHSCKQKQ